jgi:hypothetical protein
MIDMAKNDQKNDTIVFSGGTPGSGAAGKATCGCAKDQSGAAQLANDGTPARRVQAIQGLGSALNRF